MTIYEVLKQNTRILEGMRIPAGERNLWDAIQAVLDNDRNCIAAIEAADLPKAEAEEDPVPEAVPAEEAPEEG